MGLERGSLSLVSTIEELPGRNSSGSGLENREYGRGYPLRWPRLTLYPQKLALTSPTSDGRSVGIVCSRAQATEFFLYTILEYTRLSRHRHALRMNLRAIRHRPEVCVCLLSQCMFVDLDALLGMLRIINFTVLTRCKTEPQEQKSLTT
jgi:hypothetical protein